MGTERLSRRTQPLKRSRRPLILIINYIVYSIGTGWAACWWYVSRYDGKMPPSGSFDDFLADTYGRLTVGFLAPIIFAIVMHFMGKRKRSAD